MTHPLVLTSPTFSTDGPFAGVGSLSDGTASLQGILPASGAFTLCMKLKSAPSSATPSAALAFDASNWLGIFNSGAALSLSNGDTINSSATVADGTWHSVEVVCDTNQTRLYVDTALIYTSTYVYAYQNGELDLRTFRGRYGFTGAVSQLALIRGARTTGSTCTPLAKLTGSETNLVAAWPLSVDGNDIATAASTAYTLSGPTLALIGGVSAAFTVAANGVLASSVTVTPSATGGGSFSPATVTLTPGSTGATFTYTPAKAGQTTITTTNSAGLANPVALTCTAMAAATAITISPTTASGAFGAPIALTLGANGGQNGGPILLSDNGAYGAFSVNSPLLPAGDATQSVSVTYTPSDAAAGTGVTISAKSATLTGTGIAGSAAVAVAAIPTAASSGTVILRGRLLNRRPILARLPVGSGGGSTGATAPRLTGGVLHQMSPLDVGGAFAEAGNILPVGGIAPYKIETPNAGAEGYQTVDENGYLAASNSSGKVSWLGGVPNAAGFTARITDARGDTWTGKLPVQVSSAPTFSVNGVTPNTSITHQPYFIPWSSLGLTYTITKQDGSPSTAWTWNGGSFAYNGALPPTAGAYPVTIKGTESNGTVHTLNLAFDVVAAPTTTSIEFAFDPNLSSASLKYDYVGVARANSPNNQPTFSCIDPGGYFTISATTGVINLLKPFPAAGAYPLSVTVTDQAASFTQTVSVAAQAGTLLPAGNISFTATGPIDNYLRNQDVGTLSVTGMANPVWSIDYLEYWNDLVTNPGGGADLTLFSVTPATGHITAPGMLSARAYSITATARSGTAVCRQIITVTPVWHTPSVPVVYVGAGFSTNPPTSHGVGPGYEKWSDFLLARNGNRNNPGGSGRIDPAFAGGTVYIDNAMDVFNDYGTYDDHYGIGGPFKLKWLNAGGRRPRMGGPPTQTQGGYEPNGDKAFLNINDGEVYIEGIEFMNVRGIGHQPDATYGGRSIVRKNGNTYGDLTAIDCAFHDGDNGMSSYTFAGRTTVQRCVNYNCSGTTQGAGFTHAYYVGGAELVFSQNLSYNHMGGHCLKVRSKKGTITGNRLYDGETGSASNQLNIPEGGDYVITGNVFHKGPNPQNPICISFLEDAGVNSPGTRNVLNAVISANTIIVGVVGGAGIGVPCGVALVSQYGRTIYGEAPTWTIDGNSMFLGQGATQVYGNNLLAAPTNTTLLTLPPALSFADPGTANPPASAPGAHAYPGWCGGGNAYPNGTGGQLLPTVRDYRVASSAGAGTIIDTIGITGEPSRQSVASNDPAINPFAGGATISITTDPEFFPGATWAPTGAYTVTPIGNGSGGFTLKVGTVARPVGVDIIKIRLQTPAGAALPTTSDWRLIIVRT